MKVFLLILGIAAISARLEAGDSTVVSDSGEWQNISPDGKHFAALSLKPNESLIWRRDIDEGLLEVADASSGQALTVTNLDLGLYTCFSLGRRVGASAQWSPDSRYLIITTASTGGHSPWHFNSYVYCADDRTLRYMDETIGPVIQPEIKFVGSHVVQMNVGVGGPDGMDLEHPKEVNVDLDQVARNMKQLIPIKTGDFNRS